MIYFEALHLAQDNKADILTQAEWQILQARGEFDILNSCMFKKELSNHDKLAHYGCRRKGVLQFSSDTLHRAFLQRGWRAKVIVPKFKPN